VAPKSVAEYDERLTVPLRWWVQATMFLATLWLAFVVSIPSAVIAWSATAVLAAGLVAVFLGYGGARVSVHDGMFVAGTARIPVSLLADPTPLGPEATRRLAGVEANASAYLLLRPYLKRSVRVTVTDPADPVPYWLVSTRRPDQLVAAISSAMEGLHQG
jgi:hypothetical protein